MSCKASHSYGSNWPGGRKHSQRTLTRFIRGLPRRRRLVGSGGGRGSRHGESRLHHERITPAVALRLELALELSDVRAAGLPAPLQVHQERLQHRRTQATGPRLVRWSIVRDLWTSQIATDRATVHAHLSGDALDAAPG